jgi:hypothetical protein
MNRQTRHRVIISSTTLISVVGSVLLSVCVIERADATEILIAGAGQAGMGAQTAAQSSAASSAGSNAAATTNPPATTPSSSNQIAPSNISTPSFLPNSSSTNVNPQTAPNGPATSSSPPSTSAIDDSSRATAPSAPSYSLNNSINQSANPTQIDTQASSATASSGKSGATQKSGAGPQLRGLIGTPGGTLPGSENSVESFFQVNAAKTGPGYKLMNAGSVSGSSPAANHTALWHIMDNLGIPVPTGSNAEALDPSLRRNYVNPELPEINHYKSRSVKRQPLIEEAQNQPPAIRSAQQPAPSAINIQKIPDSELEGLDFSAKNDDQNKQK